MVPALVKRFRPAKLLESVSKVEEAAVVGQVVRQMSLPKQSVPMEPLVAEMAPTETEVP